MYRARQSPKGTDEKTSPRPGTARAAVNDDLSAIKIDLKASGLRNGTGTVIVTGPLNSVEPDVAVYSITWTVAKTNTGTIRLSSQEP
jgi:hypothetical protein